MLWRPFQVLKDRGLKNARPKFYWEKKLIEIAFKDIFMWLFKGIGLSIDSGLHIKTIAPGSAAAEEETLSIGDKILSVSILIHFWPMFPSYTH